MAERRDAAGPPPLVLKAGAEFRGLVYLQGPARIEGRVCGEIIAERGLWIGEEASVVARVEAEDLVVAGTLEGDVRVRARVELRAGARVRGTLDAPRLCVADGSTLEGPCRTGRSPGPGEAPHPGAGSS